MSSWKLTLPCTREEAEALEFEAPELLGIEPAPALLTRETILDDPTSWQLEVFLDRKPDNAVIAALRTLVPSSAARKPAIEKLRDEDWVTMSQAGIEPVHAGRFYIHTATNKGEVPAGAKAFRIDAGLAFGTGTHETTAGCLMMLDKHKAAGKRVKNLLDLGTGTGLLAFAALHLWPRAYATASDIDPRSIDVTAGNADINGVRLGDDMGELALAVAAGMQHPLLIGRAPYDLIIANILAGPLIELAPDIAEGLAEGGTLIIAGLLKDQASKVATAYRRQGLRLAGRIDNADWPALRFVKRRRYGADRVARGESKPGATPNFGSW